MIFKFLFIISHIILYPYIVCAVQAHFDTTPTETFFDCLEFEIFDPWDSLTEEEYIEDFPENSCDHTDFSDYEPKQFYIFGKWADDYIGHHYQSGGKIKHCVILNKQ
jgi:hypothetical protein